MQNFLFREGVGAIAAVSTGLGMLSSSLGGASGQTEQLTRSLNAGVTAFGGFDFALAALGVTGPMGLAIAGLAAGAIALADWNSAAEKALAGTAKLNVEMALLRKELQIGTAEGVITAYTEQLRDSWAAQDKLSTGTRDFWGFLKAMVAGQRGGDVSKYLWKTLGSPEELDQQAKKILEVDVAFRNWWAAVKKASGKKDPHAGEGWPTAKLLPEEGTANMFKEIGKQYDDVLKNWNKGIKTIGKTMDEVQMKMDAMAPGEAMRWGAFWSTMQAGVATVTEDITAGWSAAFDHAFGIGHTLMGKFFNTVTTYIAQIAAQLAAAATLSSFFSLFGLPFKIGFGFLTGGLSGLFGASVGMPVQPVLAPGGSEASASNRARTPVIVNVNFNSPVSDVEFVRRGIQEGLRLTGLTVDRYAVNTRSRIELTAG
jgi:hypothetical protein